MTSGRFRFTRNWLDMNFQSYMERKSETGSTIYLLRLNSRRARFFFFFFDK